MARAHREGVFVISTSVDQEYGVKFHGLNREPMSDPEQVRSYGPGSWWTSFYSEPKQAEGRILVPMDARTTAAPTGKSTYVFYRQGGWSWCVPYLVGVYALGLQVKPDLTPDQFYQAALKTGRYNEILHNGQSYKLGPIINPAGIVQELRLK